MAVDENSLEMHGESRQPFPSLCHPARETTKQYFHPVELMLDPDRETCPFSLTWVMDVEFMCLIWSNQVEMD